MDYVSATISWLKGKKTIIIGGIGLLLGLSDLMSSDPFLKDNIPNAAGWALSINSALMILMRWFTTTPILQKDET